MGALSDAARAAGGKVVGITPKLLVRAGIADNHCSELIVTPGMRERKALLEARGDAFIALPGGLGTFEEVFEILVGKLLGYHQKPIVLLNVAGYYAPLLEMIEHGPDPDDSSKAHFPARGRLLARAASSVVRRVRRVRALAGDGTFQREEDFRAGRDHDAGRRIDCLSGDG